MNNRRKRLAGNLPGLPEVCCLLRAAAGCGLRGRLRVIGQIGVL